MEGLELGLGRSESRQVGMGLPTPPSGSGFKKMVPRSRCVPIMLQTAREIYSFSGRVQARRWVATPILPFTILRLSIITLFRRTLTWRLRQLLGSSFRARLISCCRTLRL